MNKTEKFRYPISDVRLKRGKKLVKAVFVNVWYKNRYKINGTFSHKTFNGDHVCLTCFNAKFSLRRRVPFRIRTILTLKVASNLSFSHVTPSTNDVIYQIR